MYFNLFLATPSVKDQSTLLISLIGVLHNPYPKAELDNPWAKPIQFSQNPDLAMKPSQSQGLDLSIPRLTVRSYPSSVVPTSDLNIPGLNTLSPFTCPLPPTFKG